MAVISSLLAFAASDPNKAGRLFSELMPWLILLTGLVIVGGITMYWFKKWMENASQSPSEGFTLHDLRELHRKGELTDSQYEAAKATMIGRLKAARGDAATGEREQNAADR